MQQQTKLIFLFMFLWLVNKAQGQGITKWPPMTQTSPYSPNQNTWLNERGFYVLNYDWSNQQINAKLDQAVLNRTLGKVSLVGAVGSLTLGGLLYLANEMADDPRQKNDTYKTLFAVSGGLTVLSIAFPINARSKAKKAVSLRGY